MIVKEPVRQQLSDPVLVLAALPLGGLSLPCRPCERDQYDGTEPPVETRMSLIIYDE